jgi:hypothetical protein
MSEFRATLTPADLASLLQRIDDVCMQAKDLRAEIVSAMQRRQAENQPHAITSLRPSVRKDGLRRKPG